MSYLPFVIVANALLSSVVTSVMGQCPQQCSCSVVHSADCTRSSLTEIPQHGFNQHLTKLNVSFNSITNLSKISLTHVRQLTHLNLSYNNITNINENAFITLKHLNSLDLSSNNIKSIDYRTFMYNTKLQWLSLADNPKFTLPNEGFFYFQELRFLNLSYCAVQNIQPRTFKKIQNLRQLCLHNNKIASLGHGVFQPLTQLQTLNLCYNALQNIDAQVFSGLPKLRSLSLCYNNVSRLSVASLDTVIRIGRVDLEGNPWICDCDSADMYSNCAKHENCSLNLTCQFPDILKHRQWGAVDTLACTSSTVSAIELTWSEEQTINSTDGTAESTWQTVSSDQQVPEQTDFWWWVMIVLAVCCVLAFSCLIPIYRRTRKRNRNGGQGVGESSGRSGQLQNEKDHQRSKWLETII